MSLVPPVWAAVAADADVEFALVDVTRTRTEVDVLRHRRRGEVGPHRRRRRRVHRQHLNLWVCQLGGGLLGYAQFPGGPAETDGVVITYTAFGSTGTAAAPFDLGRTSTHEVGHWLNLRHIWGDDGDGCGGDDFVADTPNQAGPNTAARPTRRCRAATPHTATCSSTTWTTRMMPPW